MRSKGSVTARIDRKGRITLPRTVRTALNAELGDTVFIKYDVEGHIVRLAKAVEDPIAVLWEQAEKDFESGNTKGLRDYAKEHGI